MKTAEQLRIDDRGTGPIHQWHKWGPYVAERSWGTVREDYSWNGDAWNFFTFEHAHQRVFRWGEDAIAGLCDRYQILIFSPVFWNGKDPILKERLFGLSSHQGNHGEDVKECYYHLDATPSHSYMKYLYKYPQNEFPYAELRKKNSERSSHETEFELIDTGIFKDNAYFDIYIEYAKLNAEDVVIKIEAFNRFSKPAALHLLPHLWFRNQWAWWDLPLPEPAITDISKSTDNYLCFLADDSNLLSPPNMPFDYRLNHRYLYASPEGVPLFTNNENVMANKLYFKDAFHQHLIHNKKTINPEKTGTKSAIHYFFETIEPNDSVKIYLRLTDKMHAHPLDEIEQLIERRKNETDIFYQALHPPGVNEEMARIQRHAISGVLWNKQFYYFDVNQWLKGDNSLYPPPLSRTKIRNSHWRHLNSMRVLCMPDKWEYCWFAAWDLAFHCLTLGLADIECAKEQLWLLLFDQFQHPNGAIPAYEWEFSDLNPPVQAWAAYKLFLLQKEKWGVEDRQFLKKCFFKLIMNFAYWVNQVDNSGCNVFEGGFLGLDNITLIDRSQDQSSGGVLKQSDGTGWMAMFSLNLMRIALELAKEDPTYEGMATKFFQHFVYIAYATHKRDEKNYELWSQEDGFFYDVMVYPDGSFAKFQVRSLVGIIPLFAIETLSEKELDQFPTFKKDYLWFLKNRKILTEDCVFSVAKEEQKHYVLSLLNQSRLKSILGYLWEPEEFRSKFGIRSLSKFHEKNPFFYKKDHISYEPGESILRMKGGNSNWRGPIWLPMNYLILSSLKKYASVFDDDLNITAKNEQPVHFKEMIRTYAQNLFSLFTPDINGKRPFLGESFPFHEDPYFKDQVLFYEYFHAETGQGLGASHQAGWTALIANIIDEFLAS